MTASLHVLAIAGSLRRGSYNRALLHAAEDLAPPGVGFVHADLHDVPVFDEDREGLDAGGEAVAMLRTAVADADALLVSTPEYNQSLPGVLKNAIDWLSRPAPGRVLADKPVAVIGASSGPWGTRYAQKELRHVLAATGCVVMTSPMLFVRHAVEVFDDGNLADDVTRDQLVRLVTSLTDWTRANLVVAS